MTVPVYYAAMERDGSIAMRLENEVFDSYKDLESFWTSKVASSDTSFYWWDEEAIGYTETVVEFKNTREMNEYFNELLSEGIINDFYVFMFNGRDFYKMKGNMLVLTGWLRLTDKLSDAN
jgi:hypothetical protein